MSRKKANKKQETPDVNKPRFKIGDIVYSASHGTRPLVVEGVVTKHKQFVYTTPTDEGYKTFEYEFDANANFRYLICAPDPKPFTIQEVSLYSKYERLELLMELQSGNDENNKRIDELEKIAAKNSSCMTNVCIAIGIISAVVFAIIIGIVIYLMQF